MAQEQSNPNAMPETGAFVGPLTLGTSLYVEDLAQLKDRLTALIDIESVEMDTAKIKIERQQANDVLRIGRTYSGIVVAE